MGKIAKSIYYVLAIGLSVFFCLSIYLVSKKGMSSVVSNGLTLMYILLGLTVLASIVLSITGMVNKPKSALMTLVGVAIMAVLIGIGYAMDDKVVDPSYVSHGVETGFMSGLIGGSLIATWIILGLVVAASLVGSIIEFVRKL